MFFRPTCKSSLIAIDLYGEIERRYGDVIPVVAIAQDPYERARARLGDHFFADELLSDFPAYQASAAYRLAALPTALLVGAMLPCSTCSSAGVGMPSTHWLSEWVA